MNKKLFLLMLTGLWGVTFISAHTVEFVNMTKNWVDVNVYWNSRFCKDDKFTLEPYGSYNVVLAKDATEATQYEGVDTYRKRIWTGEGPAACRTWRAEYGYYQRGKCDKNNNNCQRIHVTSDVIGNNEKTRHEFR